MKFTVFGSSGFIGRHLTKYLEDRGTECGKPQRDDASVFNSDLGHVVYCIGMTADFRQRPLETIDAHVARLLEVLTRGRFRSLLYLSSTRVYRGSMAGDEETNLKVNPRDGDDLYNLSKLTGEAACFATERPDVRVVRLSNVYGDDWSSENFLTSIIRDALEKKQVLLQTSLDSTKDYIHVSDIIPVLAEIACAGRDRLYNVASGVNVSSSALTQKLKKLTGCSVSVAPGARAITYPQINIARVRDEFGFRPSSMLDSLATLISNYPKK
jgi:nucleoside-diphosphate-sugar epimerase